MRSIKTVSIMVSFLILLSACASGPKIHSMKEHGIDFDKYKTFGFVNKVKADKIQYDSFLGKFLKVSIAEEMQARGLTESSDPDLLINFHVNTKEKVSSTTHSSPNYGAYYGYRNYYGYSYGVGYNTDTRVRQYTEGTLNIDVVDSYVNQLVWEGVAVGKVNDKVKDNLEESVSLVVELIFEKYPIAAPAE